MTRAFWRSECCSPPLKRRAAAIEFRTQGCQQSQAADKWPPAGIQGLKPRIFKPLNVAAEAATHNDFSQLRATSFIPEMPNAGVWFRWRWRPDGALVSASASKPAVPPASVQAKRRRFWGQTGPKIARADSSSDFATFGREPSKRGAGLVV